MKRKTKMGNYAIYSLLILLCIVFVRSSLISDQKIKKKTQMNVRKTTKKKVFTVTVNTERLSVNLKYLPDLDISFPPKTINTERLSVNLKYLPDLDVSFQPKTINTERLSVKLKAIK